MSGAHKVLWALERERRRDKRVGRTLCLYAGQDPPGVEEAFETQAFGVARLFILR